MSVQTTERPLQIAFPRDLTRPSTALAIPEPPVTPANEGLAQYAQSAADARQSLSCSALLQGETRARAEAEAAEVYADMKGNTQVYLEYGSGAVEDINVVVDKLLDEIDPVKIPELKELMQHLNDRMRGIQRKYDVSDPEVREKYEKWSKGLRGFFRKARSFLDALMDDVRSIEGQLEKVDDQLEGKEEQLMRNISYYDQLYEENENSIGQLIYVVAVMELVADLAAKEIETIPVGDAAAGDRGSENRARLAEFANNMQVKAGDYKGRLMIAWATAPQTRMMRSLNVGLITKLHTLRDTTIPSMKLTIANWRLAVQAGDAAAMVQAVIDSNNEWTQAYFRSSGQLVARIADSVQTPTLSPQTIALMAQTIADEADSIIKAMDDGYRRRAELEDAMRRALPVLKDASARVSDAVVQRVLDTATNLEIATSVPAQLPAGASR